MFEASSSCMRRTSLNGAFTLRDRQAHRVPPDRSGEGRIPLGLQFEVLEEVIEGRETDVRVMMSYRADHYGPEQVERIKQTVDETFILPWSSMMVPLASL
ncbi:hypothetical protein DSL92_07740 [Billgrantia gudaonensis]|uniref:Uncharacterized protein n=1 Tax=Billgrantia gudaonensis TaxID=376427 RepID=A0A432JH11_9GAMM|nr:hypothetical protein DSL92_07740 [Halomonas gudaonensis]